MRCRLSRQPCWQPLQSSCNSWLSPCLLLLFFLFTFLFFLASAGFGGSPAGDHFRVHAAAELPCRSRAAAQLCHLSAAAAGSDLCGAALPFENVIPILPMGLVVILLAQLWSFSLRIHSVPAKICRLSAAAASSHLCGEASHIEGFTTFLLQSDCRSVITYLLLAPDGYGASCIVWYPLVCLVFAFTVAASLSFYACCFVAFLW